MNNRLISILMTIGMTLVSITVMAGPGGAPGSGAPIDGGVTALLIGSAYYGYKKLKANRKEREDRKEKGE